MPEASRRRRDSCVSKHQIDKAWDNSTRSIARLKDKQSARGRLRGGSCARDHPLSRLRLDAHTRGVLITHALALDVPSVLDGFDVVAGRESQERTSESTIDSARDIKPDRSPSRDQMQFDLRGHMPLRAQCGIWRAWESPSGASPMDSANF
eukprot:1653572-Pleurochrysis_carterae.AAC.3